MDPKIIISTKEEQDKISYITQIKILMVWISSQHSTDKEVNKTMKESQMDYTNKRIWNKTFPFNKMDWGQSQTIR